MERVLNVEVFECKYNSNTCDQMIFKLYVCVKFSQQILLNVHKALTHEIPYICDVCSKTFQNYRSLNVNMM